jgi:hypothetical protein
VDHAGCTHILAKSGITDLKKLNVPTDTYYFCQNSSFMFNFRVKLTRQQSKCFEFISKLFFGSLPKEVMMVMAIQRPQPTTNHESEDADQYNGITKIRAATFISAACCLPFCFSNLIEMVPQSPW